jgi:SAM-dependent methyltransferase
MINTPFAERDASYYDRIYAAGYPTRAYRPVYAAVLDFLRRMAAPAVLEVGCGTGDLAELITGADIPYRGFDISPVAIARCRVRGLVSARLGNAYDEENYEPHDYNLVVALEVFEHIDDRRAIGCFPEGVHVLFSVPDFVETAHLRAYQEPQRDIIDYYAGHLAVGQVLPFRFVSDCGKILTIFLVHAVAGPGPCESPLVR